MKNAYSNLLGEFVEASEVENEDTAGFQIVCPCCRDAVFRVHQDRGRGSVEYFSHYRTPSDIVAECERRVGSISLDERFRVNEKSRLQTLELFRSVIRDALYMLPIRGQVYTEGESANSTVTAAYAPKVKALIKSLSDTSLRGFVAANDELINECGYTTLTKFDSSIRNRISADLLRTLVARSSRSFDYILMRSFTSLIEIRLPDDELVQRSKRFENLRRAYRANKRPASTLGVDDFTCFFLDGMLRELHKLPYFKMIENAQRKLPTMHGITPESFLPDLEEAILEADVLDRRVVPGVQNIPKV